MVATDNKYWHNIDKLVSGADPGFCNGGGGGIYMYMLDHLRCAVGAVPSQKILNFGVSWGMA